MSVLVRCRSCKRLVPHERPQCLCGISVPKAGRDYYLSGRVNGIQKKKRLGLVTLEFARRKDHEFFGGNAPPPVLTWKEIRYAYLSKLELERRGERYFRATALYLKEMATFWGDDTPADCLTKELVRDYFYSLTKRPKPYSPASINRRLAAGRGAYNYSIDLPNPFNRVPTVKEVERTAYLTEEERTRLLDCALRVSPTLWQILQTCLHTGLRRMEVLTLRWDQIDLEAGIAMVIQKGNRQRTVYLSDELRAILSEIPRTSEYVWPGKNGHLNEYWRRPFHRALKLAGLDGRITMHDLRHVFGTEIYLKTGDIRAAKELLGHTDIKTTMRYAHALPSHLKSVMDNLWSKPSSTER